MQENDIDISIIIPVYNGDLFIERAYKHICRQQIDAIEVLFIDNNSVDNSVKIIEQIANNDPRVKLLRQPKQGAAAARNEGLKVAKGKYIYFFDVDDELLDFALQRLKEVLDKNPQIDSVFGKYFRSRTSLEKTKIPHDETHVLTEKETPYYGLKWFGSFGSLQGIPAYLHRRSVFDIVGIFNEKLLLGEDAFLHIMIGLKCKVAYLDTYIYMYFRHPNSTVSKSNKIQAKVFTYWPQLITAYLPYYLNNSTSKSFNHIFFRQLYGYIPSMLCKTKPIKQRLKIYKKAVQDIKPLKIPIIINAFIILVVLTGSLNLYKLCQYYAIPYYVKWFVK
jgi:glycosyltransferase involved in cell wall biosynthesis